MIASFIALVLAQQTGDLAPEFVGKEWLNTDKPLSMSNRKGKVTLVYFWTFACSNCINNMPAMKNLSERYRPEGVETISIHTPELPQERDLDNLKKAIAKRGIKYPVLVDGNAANWKAWKTNVWPCLYVVDKHNRIRGGWQGELNYNGQGGEGKMAQLIRKLLNEN